MRLRIDLAYDGTGFHGWARQPGLRTVQGELEAAFDTVLRTAGTELTVAGRTDAGVHARGQVCHLDVPGVTIQGCTTDDSTRHSRRLDGLVRRLNGVLDQDVRVWRISEVPEGFDARFSAIWRRYRYRIADRPEAVDPVQRGHVLAWPRRLDEEAMNQASGPLLGEHDFAAFCRRREGASTVRTLQRLAWERGPDGLLVAEIRSDAFCHHMVRALVGCLVAVGEGRRKPDWPAEVLARRQRDPAVTVMHAHPLVLEEVGYPPDDRLADQATASRVLRGPVPGS
ncbi:MAG: tRNA pseudouridine(38-40) synthase TruA [Marmoricola sp.]